MDSRVPTGIRGSEDLPLIPSVAKFFLAWGRVIPLLSSILGTLNMVNIHAPYIDHTVLVIFYDVTLTTYPLHNTLRYFGIHFRHRHICLSY